MSSSSSSTRLSLAYRDLEEVPPSLLAKYATTLTELDLSNNRLTQVSFLRGLAALETLVLDGNRLTHQARFPPLGRLQTLWVNRNAIGLLPTFLDRLAEAVPRLRFLSMLGNQACPNYLTGGTLKQYKDYRLFVLSRLRHLDMLVTEEERQEAIRLYGNLDVSGAEAMYKRQTLDQGNPAARELAVADDEQQREAAAKEEEGRRKGTSTTDGRRRKSSSTGKRATKKGGKSTKTPPAAEPGKGQEEPAAASVVPSAVAHREARQGPTGVSPTPYVDDLPDPLTDHHVPRGLPPPPPGALRVRGGVLDEAEDEEVESDWTDDDSEDVEEVCVALDLPDFSSDE